MQVFFKWESSQVGVIFCFLGLFVIPLNMLLAKLSLTYSDRRILIIAEAGVIIGLILMVNMPFFGQVMPIVQYITGLVFVFLACQIMEGVSTSILSKCMPAHMASGIFNSGFISTQAGTSGRAVGNVSISLAGYGGLFAIENLIFIPLVVFTLLCSLLSLYAYSQLKVRVVDKVI